jgi:hypothetical protein
MGHREANFSQMEKRAVESMSGDLIESPDHYTAGGIETIDFMQAKLTAEQFEGYLTANVIKYMSRYRYKNGAEDVRKARWYVNKLIELLDKEA